jgi:pimeloyl-ACP methyl ester carboxylesterase/predicted glycosyltransferase
VDLTLSTREGEQTRARYPDATGDVVRAGVRIHWESYGAGERTLLLLPTWSIIHTRHWKMQIPYLARHCRVVTFDGRGNGASDRPLEGYDGRTFTDDALGVLDATGTQRATVVSLSMGAQWALALAAEQPTRVDGVVFICPAVSIGEPAADRRLHSWNDELDTDEGWAKYNRHYWHRDYRGFLEFFFGQMFTEPHSTKPIEDCVGWGLETTPDVLVATQLPDTLEADAVRTLAARIEAPVLVIQGTADAITGPGRGSALAGAAGGHLVLLDGSGHGPHVRDPVAVNHLLRDFVAPPTPPARWIRGRSRAKRALYVSSPIGLGHARRDVAIADELRKLHAGLEIEWLAQDPVTRVLEARGERVHPASAQLANESAHIERESTEHELHCFQAIRRMDEILLANFMVFDDVVRDEQYDLWIGDEAWELDYYLHENPELKRAPYVWLTDFVGWLPMPDGAEHERFLTADYNAEMIEHIARFPRIRDRALFVGNPDDIVPDSFGPGLPLIRDWTEEHFEFSGYITGFDPGDLPDRATLGYHADERVCVVTVGGSGVGASLLRRVIDAFPEAKARIPNLRMIVVAGPRIDPLDFPQHDGLEVRAYVHDLYQHLAACDLAIVQGGLTTAMELIANRRPFLSFPLRNHFEQNLHVRHRLERYGAGRFMDFETDGAAEIADAIVEELGREVDYRPVETDGAARAAASIAELL